MIINGKLPEFKNFMNEMTLGKDGLKSTINDSAVSGTEKNNVALELEQDKARQDLEKKKKRQKEQEEEEEAKVLLKTSAPQNTEDLRKLYLAKLTLI